MDEHNYAVIMAGGGGTRLWPISRKDRPKQLLPLLGDETLFQGTVARLGDLFPPERILVVTVERQAAEMQQQVPEIPVENYLIEPAPRGTASVVGLAAMVLRTRDPEAAMAILPSDHFILPGHRFMRAVAAAAKFVEDGNVDVPVLLAVKPDGPESEYGWIELGACIGDNDQRTIHQLKQYVEKPPRNVAERLLQDGWLWNTMVIVVRAQALMDLAWKSVPDLARWFTLLQRIMGSPREQEFIKKVYEAIPKTNFSTSVLASRNLKSLVLPIRDVCWSDWGTKERILETARAHGLRPSVRIRTPHDPVAIPV